MQDARLNSYEQHVSECKHVYTNTFFMITFPEKIIYGYPHLCGQEVYVKHICEAKIVCPNRDVI